MYRSSSFVLFAIRSILLLTVSKAMAEGPITVYGPKEPEEQKSLVLTEIVNVAPGGSTIRKFAEPFKTIHIANDKILNAEPLNDRSILLIGKEVGETDVDVLGETEPIAILSVSVAKSALPRTVSNTAGSYVVVHDRNSISDTTQYWCKQEAVCERAH
jgi:Flp pilus assembly secretin CpaC